MPAETSRPTAQKMRMGLRVRVPLNAAISTTVVMTSQSHPTRINTACKPDEIGGARFEAASACGRVRYPAIQWRVVEANSTMHLRTTRMRAALTFVMEPPPDEASG